MAKSTVYRSFEVREGFGPSEVGPLVFESESRGEADSTVSGSGGDGSLDDRTGRTHGSEYAGTVSAI